MTLAPCGEQHGFSFSRPCWKPSLHEVPYLDLDAERDVLALGTSDSEVCEHVLYGRAPGRYPEGVVSVGFYLMISNDDSDVRNPFRDVLAFQWER